MPISNQPNYLFIILVLFAFLVGCSTPKTVVSTDDDQIEIAFLQMNDVYEISGVDGGRVGGLSRVAHYYKEMKKQYPQSMMVLAGDFLNPSLIGTMRHEGERIRGKQMVEVLNAMDLDVVAFGNHEFDLGEDDLQLRINESEFDWISTNINQVCGDKLYPFYKEVNGRKQFMPESMVYSFQDIDGTKLDVGVFSACINSNPTDYVTYFNPDSCVALELEMLKSKSDVQIGLTHLEITHDLELAKKHPEVMLIMGGHEHNNMFHRVKKTTVAKADANAKTIYVHVIKVNKKTGKRSINSDLITIDESIPKDPEVDAIIEKWNEILETNIKQVIPEPYEVVYHATTPLDGKETTIRHKPSNMGKLFTGAMLAAAKNNSVAAIMNSGSIRIDDEIEGDIAAIDIFRALPYGGTINEITVTGNLLFGILRYGENSPGNGAYLQYSGIEKKGDEWYVAGSPLDKEGTYTIALNDFLLRGLDIPFLTEENTGISTIYKPDSADTSDLRNELRKAIITYLKGL